MRVAAISNRRFQRAVEVYKYSGHEEVIAADTQIGSNDAGRRQVGVTISICLKGHDKLSEGLSQNLQAAY